MRRYRSLGFAGTAALAVAALAAAGCSSGSSPSSSSTSTPTSSASSPAASTSSTPAATSTTGGEGAQSVTNYLTYTDGKSGAANNSLPPVQIGWLNQQGGQSAVGPLATAGAEMAVKYINAQLGGVDGHPLKLDTCFIANTDAEGTTCGQQFAANKSIQVIGEGGVAIGVQTFYTAIGSSTPVVVGVAATGTDGVQPNAVILFGDATHVLGPFGTYATQVLHAKTAALVYPDIAGITEGAAAIKTALQAAGVTVKAVGYPESQTDLTSVLTAAGAQTADMVIPYSDSTGCVNLANSLKQLGITDPKKIVSAPLCLNGQVAAGLRRQLAAVDVRDRQLQLRRHDRPGHAAVHERVGQVRVRGRRAGPVEHRGVLPAPDHRQVHERGWVREPVTLSHPGQGQGVHRSPGARRPVAALRRVPTLRQSATTEPTPAA